MSDKVFNALTAEDLEKIDRYIEAYGDHSESAHPSYRASLDYVLRFWNKNKANLFEMFGEKLIVSEDIAIEKDLDMIIKDVNGMYSTYDHDGHYVGADQTVYGFSRDWYNMIDQHFSNDSAEIIHALESLLRADTLANNEYNGPTVKIYLGDNKWYKLQTGTKAMRAINKISTAYEIPNFEYFCNKHSQVLNDKMLKGKLSLSIHPLDYMTMSDNNSDWSSCMSWIHDGGYHQGTVEMMNSPYVVCAYLEGSAPMTFDHDQEWNNKKWRELFIVNEDIIVGVKGYPYINRALENCVTEKLKNLASKYYTNSDYTDKKIELGGEDNYDVIVDIDEHTCKRIEVNFTTSLMYNDFGCGHYAYINKNVSEDGIDICYSGETECVWCGEDLGYSRYDSEDLEGRVVCPDCSGCIKCAHCDGLYAEEEGRWIDGVFYCNDCYEENFCEDVFSGDIYNKEEMDRLFIVSVKEQKWGYLEAYGYSESQRDLYNKVKEYFDGRTDLLYKFHRPWWGTMYGINADNLSDEDVKDFFTNGWYTLWRHDIHNEGTDFMLVSYEEEKKDAV